MYHLNLKDFCFFCDHQIRVQELEVAIEAKENEAIRALKASKKSSRHQALKSTLDTDSNMLSVGDTSAQKQMDKTAIPIFDSTRNESKNHVSGSTNVMDLEEITDAHIFDKKGASKASVHTHGHINSEESPRNSDCAVQRPFLLRPEEGTGNKAQTSGQVPNSLVGSSSPKIGFNNNGGGVSPADVDVIVLDDSAQVEPVLNIRKGNSSPVVLSQPGSFSC